MKEDNQAKWWYVLPGVLLVAAVVGELRVSRQFVFCCHLVLLLFFLLKTTTARLPPVPDSAHTNLRDVLFAFARRTGFQ